MAATATLDGLEDLRRRVGARGARELAEALGRAAAGRAGSDALFAVAEAYRDYAKAHPGQVRAAQRSRELSGSDEAVAASGAAVEVVLAVLRGYRIEGEDALHATAQPGPPSTDSSSSRRLAGSRLTLGR